MANIVKPIMGATLGLQGVALAGRAMQTIPKEWMNPKMDNKKSMMMKKQNMRNQNKNLIRGFTDIAVGTAFLVPTAAMVNEL